MTSNRKTFILLDKLRRYLTVVGSAEPEFIDFIKAQARKAGYHFVRFSPARLAKLQSAGVRFAEDCDAFYLSYWLRTVFTDYYCR